LLRIGISGAAELRVNRGNLIGTFFRDEVIGAGLHFQKRGIERTCAAIVRLQMKSGSVALSSGRFELCKRQAPEAGGNQRCASSLAETEKKVASAEINSFDVSGLKIGGLRWLPCPAQSNVPRKIKRGTEANIQVWGGQGKRVFNFNLNP